MTNFEKKKSFYYTEILDILKTLKTVRINLFQAAI